ncbi:hypothetical protein T440DRAFT_523282 [Plenodomus tracheiphilus IPT5]|uniref:Uncharacterized protein n=1 Tax=Plenodomus tracheiphilus IPT5 TaxID=1408161 RepID=A0A6A7ARI2_9PLEO|nr:hypothetical protein T440DRAFT_523282 [Plenodomus tracheiphilus IPT5]
MSPLTILFHCLALFNMAFALPTDLATAINIPTIKTSSSNAQPSTANTAGLCGQFTIHEGGFAVPTYTSNICTNTDEFETMVLFENWGCGLCIVFHGRQCQGDIRWSGGPDALASHHVDGAQSYFCY